MKLPDVISPEYIPQNIFPLPEQSIVVKHRPVGGLGSNKVDFYIPKSQDAIDLQATRILVKLKVVKKDNTNLPATPADKYMGIINNALGSFFTSLTVSINQQQIIQNTAQHVLSYVINTLNTSADFRKCVLYPAGYFDTPAKGVSLSTSAGFTASNKLIEKSIECVLFGSITHPFFLQKKVLIPGCDLNISMLQSSQDLFLMTNVADLKIEVSEIALMIRYIKIELPLLKTLEDKMKITDYTIPFVRTELLTFQIATGANSFNHHNLFTGILPSRITFMLTASEDYKGKSGTSPYSFESFGLSSYRYNYNSTLVPILPISCDVSKSVAELYAHVNHQLGVDTGSLTPSLTYEKFIADHHFISQSFVSDCSSNYMSLPGQTGVLGLQLEFSKAVTKNLTLILICEYHRSYVSISKEGNVKVIG